MRHSPFSSPAVFTRVIIKAVVLLLLFNLVCLVCQFDPLAALMNFNTGWLIGHGRERLYYTSDSGNGILPLEALLASHTIAYTPKASDEYRVLAIGDSGINGVWSSEAETFSTLLTNRGLRINGKRVVAYNLAYPGPNIVKNTLILDATLQYQPDLILSFVAPTSFYNARLSPYDELSTFIELNRSRLERLTNQYGLQAWLAMYLPPEPALSQWSAIRNADALPVWLKSLFYPFTTTILEWQGPRIEWAPVPEEVPFRQGVYGFERMPNDTWKFLQIEQNLALEHHIPLLIINEPTVIMPGPNYNTIYQRSFYDDYRAALSVYLHQADIWFADLWDTIPAKFFTDNPSHFDGSGSAILVNAVTQTLRDHFGDANMVVPPPSRPRSDSVQMTFDQKDIAPFGDGWLPPEGTQTWMGATTATLDLVLVPARAYKITFRVAQALTPDILASLRLSVNSQPVTLSSQADNIGGATFTGLIPQTTIDLNADNTHLEFQVNRVATPASLGLNNDPRLLALKFDWLRLEPSQH